VIKFFRALVILAALILTQLAFSQAPTTQLTWYGHSAFRLQTPKGHVLWIDPWLSNPSNPSVAKGKDPLSIVDRADYIVLTHGHFDHVGESLQIAEKTKARLVAPFDLADAMIKVRKYPANQVGFDTMGGPGGELKLADGEITISFIQAIHSSNLDVPGGEESGIPAVYGGVAVGYVIQIKDGPTIYDS
jgi:L-ascorbate metabolism protein UlaG (beta-lactamase superfamily)